MVEKDGRKILAIITICIILISIGLSGCVEDGGEEEENNNNEVEEFYYGITAKIIFGETNLSSGDLMDMLEKENISYIKEVTHIDDLYWPINRHNKTINDESFKVAISINGYSDTTYFPNNLTVIFQYTNETRILATDPESDKMFEENKNSIEYYVNTIEDIFYAEFSLKPLELIYEKEIECPYDP